MKTILLPLVSITALFIGMSLLALGSVSFVEISKAMEDYRSSQHPAGSSVPYPAYDQAKSYFVMGGIVLAAGGSLLVIWRKRK